ncbi:MAG: hypothetical protein U0587_05235 [Candidatus Binatia bacterium]
MTERYAGCAALAIRIVLGLGILAVGGWYSAVNPVQPRPVHAGTVSAGMLTQLDTTNCTGDCNGDAHVTVDEVLRLIAVALDNGAVDGCGAADVDGNERITVDEIVIAVDTALNGCPAVPLPTATPTEIPSAVPTATPTETPTPAPTATPSITPGGPLPVADAVARDGNGVAIRLNQTVTTEGVVTVSAGVLANNKLKVFLQSDGAGIEVYDQTAAHVPPGDFEAAQRCRVTGVIRQADPAGEDVLAGTVMVDVSAGSWTVLSAGNPLPVPQTATLHDVKVKGIPYAGVLVRVAHVQKVSGTWPVLGSKTTSVTISDDGGTTQLPLRFQRNTITVDLANKLKNIGNAPFNVAGIAVQNALDGNLSANFEIWVRGADDIAVP